jgi:hypothetical protein
MTAASNTLIVDHAMTADLDDGSPVVPGFADDGIFWALVRRRPHAMATYPPSGKHGSSDRRRGRVREQSETTP